MILANLIDQVGASNPQIFRELKERLTIRNIGITVIAALAIQVIIWVYFNGQLPIPTFRSSMRNGVEVFDNNSLELLKETFSQYCIPHLSIDYGSNTSNACQLDAATREFQINWRKWRSDIFICQSWILSIGLILGSVYMLVTDLVQEEKRGTLNFIRLSPQSARTIFIGKILGVPILIYLGVILIAPLHLLMGSMAGAGTKLLVSWYLLMGFGWFLLSSAAVLYVLLGGVQALAIVAAVACPILPLWIINTLLSETIYRATWFMTIDHLDWFGFAINTSAIRVYVFGIIICLISSYWVWSALERRYLNPTATVISKSQSYLLNLCLQLGIAGFTIPLLFQSSGSYYFNRQTIGVCATIEAISLLLFIPMLLPSKQAIQDWSRYRRERTYLRRKFWQREDLVRDLLTNDKSPATLAIMTNLGIAMIFWLPAAIFAIAYPRYTQVNESTYGPGMKILIGICLAVSLLLIYTAIAHVGLFLKVRNQKLWIFAGITGLMTLPIVGAYLLSPNSLPANSLGSILLLFSPLAPMISLHLSIGTSLATFTAQLGIFAILTRQLQQKLQISGRSLTKELTANN